MGCGWAADVQPSNNQPTNSQQPTTQLTYQPNYQPPTVQDSKLVTVNVRVISTQTTTFHPMKVGGEGPRRGGEGICHICHMGELGWRGEGEAWQSWGTRGFRRGAEQGSQRV